ncbi:MAG: hypothetical protein RIS45_1268 [Planctomycetota bacterium]|jgi:hypothetical protein
MSIDEARAYLASLEELPRTPDEARSLAEVIYAADESVWVFLRDRDADLETMRAFDAGVWPVSSPDFTGDCVLTNRKNLWPDGEAMQPVNEWLARRWGMAFTSSEERNAAR